MYIHTEILILKKEREMQGFLELFLPCLFLQSFPLGAGIWNDVNRVRACVGASGYRFGVCNPSQERLQTENVLVLYVKCFSNLPENKENKIRKSTNSSLQNLKFFIKKYVLHIFLFDPHPIKQKYVNLRSIPKINVLLNLVARN